MSGVLDSEMVLEEQVEEGLRMIPTGLVLIKDVLELRFLKYDAVYYRRKKYS